MSKILVIEDETILREEMAEWLSLEDYEVFSAADGMAGVSEAFRCQPDLIVCDITMPLLDGYGVLMELRANPAMAATPFIFVTARASHEDMRKGMGLGADDYITKPFTRIELLEAIQTRLEKTARQKKQRQSDVEQWQQAFEHERDQRLLKSKLVAMFSHDFRNPLSTILYSVNMVRDFADRIDEQRRLKHLNRAEASVLLLIQMLDDMLFVSQMDAGKLSFFPEQMNVSEFLQAMVDEFQAIHADTHTLSFISHFSDKVMADRSLLRQIASNLISNAVKYSPQGGEVQVSLRCVDNHLELSVKDQGIGIPDTDQPNLFAAFQRASNVHGISGTGLGLTIVKQATDLHGGSVALESAVGIGTTVIVKIPMKESTNAAARL